MVHFVGGIIGRQFAAHTIENDAQHMSAYRLDIGFDPLECAAYHRADMINQKYAVHLGSQNGGVGGMQQWRHIDNDHVILFPNFLKNGIHHRGGQQVGIQQRRQRGRADARRRAAEELPAMEKVKMT